MATHAGNAVQMTSGGIVAQEPKAGAEEVGGRGEGGGGRVGWGSAAQEPNGGNEGGHSRGARRDLGPVCRSWTCLCVGRESEGGL